MCAATDEDDDDNDGVPDNEDDDDDVPDNEDDDDDGIPDNEDEDEDQPDVLTLVGGSGPHEGNLMINGEPVCDDGWSGNEVGSLQNNFDLRCNVIFSGNCRL